jgi:signal transduction histidine kinase
MRELALGILISFVILALIVTFCAVLINIYVTKIKQYNKQLFAKELEHQQAVNTAIVETQNETLDKISRDLHDDIGQQLTVINLQLEQIKLRPDLKSDTLEPVSKNLRQLSSSLRELSHGLTSHALDGQSLFSAFAKELKRCDKLGVQCSLQIKSQKDFHFSKDQSIILYRIFQEILNNMLKHSQAENFEVIVSRPSRPVFEFKDNGKGMDNPEAAMASNGLNNIKFRASIIDYDFQLRSDTSGTQIILEKKLTHD